MGGELFIGVDGGTGDMEAVAVDREGAIRGRGRGGPSNDPEVVGRMNVRVGQHVVSSIRAALRQAGASPSDIEAVSLNLSGDPSALTRQRAARWLRPLRLSPRTVLAVDQDGLSAWAAGGFPDPSIWVLLGTNCGSEGMRNGRKIEHPLGKLDMDAHFGRPVGAAVTGSWGLGLAVRSAFGGERTALLSAYQQALGLRDARALADWARQHATSDERAELFRPLAETAASGDRVAARLLREAGATVAELTICMADCMGVGRRGRKLTIVLAGKVWRADGVLLRTFRRRIAASLAKAEIRINEVSQAQGAALLAMRHAGLDAGPELFQRLD